MTFLAMKIDRRAAGHAVTALRNYRQAMKRQGYRLDPEVAREFQDLEEFLAESGKSRKNAANPAGVGQDNGHDGTDDLLTQKQAAYRAKCSERTIRNWLDRGLLDAVYVGKVRRVSAIQLEQFIGNGSR